jgi:V/A-type H+/Na+-transporting ATPase subunit I
MNFIVSTPEPMWRMRVLTPKDHAAQALKALQKAGVLHPEQGEDLEPVDRAAIEREWSTLLALLRHLDDVLEYAPEHEVLRLRGDTEAFLVRPAGEIARDTHRACAKLTAMHRRLAALDEELSRWEELRRIAAALSGRPGLSTRDFDFSGPHLFSRLAVLPRDEFELVQDRLEALSLVLEVIRSNDEIAVFMVGNAWQLPEVQRVVSRHGRFLAAPGESEPMDGFAARADAELARLNAAGAALRGEIEARTRASLEELVLLREALYAERERLALLRLACESRYVTLIQGWVPASALEEVRARLVEEVGCVHVEASQARPDDQPPSRLRNAAGLRPFEVIIGLFATPRYGEWDPTPIVAYFFALFFGVMLGDVLYGALLLLIAHFLLPRMASDPEAEGLRMFRQLLYICAGAAIVFGLLTGSYMGDFLVRFLGAPELALSQTLKGLYLDPMLFIVVSLAVGLVHVNLGHLLMLVRGVRERIAHAVLGRVALFLLQLALLPWLLRLLGVDWLPLGEAAYTALAWLGVLATVMVIVASLLERGGFLGSILWVFDVTGLLGDVMSYARLAGVGLATYFLAYSFNMIAMLVVDMMPAGLAGAALGAVLVMLILVFGHLLNLVLSSITCFVHALRLCFVEFLFKFYEGGGQPYAPFRLRRRTRVPVRPGGAAARG